MVASHGAAPPRGGCAAISGVFLIAVGSLFLASNLLSHFGVSPVRVAIEALHFSRTYGPVLLIAWGGYKLYQRYRHPESAGVGGVEVVVVVSMLVLVLAIRGAERLVNEVATGVSLDEFASVLGPDLLPPPHRAVEQRTFEPGDANVLVIENENGRVVVTGSEERALEVRVEKQIHGFSDAEATRALSAAVLELHTGDEGVRLRISRGDGSRAIRTDWRVRAPKSLAVKVDSRRGGVRIEGFEAPVEVRTTNGDVEAVNLSAVDIETARATVRLEKISGTVRARNEYGAIHARSIDGDVSATTEYGIVTTEHVNGSVVLRTEHGTVRTTNTTGTVDIVSPYSEVSVERSSDGVSIASSHRPVFVYGVRGELELAAPFARVVVRGVGGDVSVENRHRAVSVADVGGTVTVVGEHSAVEIDAANGAVTVDNSHEDVRVSDFGSRLEVRTSHADVDVSANRLDDALRVETSYGDISLALPAHASAAIVATTRAGELHSEFVEVTSTGESRDRDRRWEGTLGGGAHRVSLATSYGDIMLRPRP